MLQEIEIENLIYEIRGKQVMLDSEVDVKKCHELFIYNFIFN